MVRNTNNFNQNIQYYMTYKEIADLLHISYELVAKKHAPRIIEKYKLDRSRMPKNSGVLPYWAIEDYFYLNKKIN